MARVCLVALLLAVALPAWAQHLTLEISDGLVTLSATDVPARKVLERWALVGGTRVVGAERVSGPPLTLNLEGVPEAKVLDIILRDAAGYVAAARPAAGSGRSVYDRILVLATSTPPAKGAAIGAAVSSPLTARLGAPPVAEPDDQTAAVADVPDGNEQPLVSQLPDTIAQTDTGRSFEPAGPSIPFGTPVPGPGQPFLQDVNIFKYLPPADEDGAAPASGFFGTSGSPGIPRPTSPVG